MHAPLRGPNPPNPPPLISTSTLPRPFIRAGIPQPSAHYRSYLLGRDQPPRLPERAFVEAADAGAAQVLVTPTVLSRSGTGPQRNPAAEANGPGLSLVVHSAHWAGDAGDSATVTWSGVTQVADNDWIGVYLRNDSAHTDYLDYVYVTEVGLGQRTRAGAVERARQGWDRAGSTGPHAGWHSAQL